MAHFPACRMAQWAGGNEVLLTESNALGVAVSPVEDAYHGKANKYPAKKLFIEVLGEFTGE